MTPRKLQQLLGVACAILFAGPAAAAGVTLFQWEDYMDPPFLA